MHLQFWAVYGTALWCVDYARTAAWYFIAWRISQANPKYICVVLCARSSYQVPIKSCSVPAAFRAFICWPKFSLWHSSFSFSSSFHHLRLPAVQAQARQALLFARGIRVPGPGFWYATPHASMDPILTFKVSQRCEGTMTKHPCETYGSGVITILRWVPGRRLDSTGVVV